MSNKLSFSTSPYLLQHADNPVDWFPWGAAALQKAQEEDKPIFLSIGYAACHWCHVMAHESFEDPETAAIMNTHFVNIKVDREERPDLDTIYMQAVTAMTGQGGWPMSVFLTPDLRPFFGGTYFPPVPRYRMPSFKDVLLSLAHTWEQDREKIHKSGQQVAEHIAKQFSDYQNSPFSKSTFDAAAQGLLQNYDWNSGGWGRAPKFPQPMSIETLLRYIARPGAALASQAYNAIRHALNAMARGGMYDVVGGGFCRYSTDNQWLAPHFEKMLYDNAQLSQVYLHAWLVFYEPFYRRITEETLQFVLREMTSPEGGFYSSLDADSEGVEGKFYVWNKAEIESILTNDAPFFIAAYGIQTAGNWEGNTILQRALDDKTLAARFNLDVESVPAKLHHLHARLLSKRNKRIRPATDDKIIAAWNGLMLASFAEAARYLNDQRYYQAATRNAEFLLNNLVTDGQLRRSWRAGRVTREVFLEDYGALILGLLALYQVDFDSRWYAAASTLADQMLARFSDPSGGFFDTPSDAETLLVRPKDLQDNATPSGSALAVQALLKLASFSENMAYHDTADKAIRQISQMASAYPTAFARWLSVMDFANGPVRQAAIIGKANDPVTRSMLNVLNAAYAPNLVVAVDVYPVQPDSPAILQERPMLNEQVTVYLCQGFVCKQPTTDPVELMEQLQ